MITVQRAEKRHVSGIQRVCTDGYWATYRYTHPEEYISRIVQEFYNEERLLQEVTHADRSWGGYFVALDNGKVVGAGGGGMIGERDAEIFVLYLDPDRRNEGIGTMLLDRITEQQTDFGAQRQWVSVQKGNQKGIPFYEAKGFIYQYEKLGYGNREEEEFISLRYQRSLV